MTTKEAPAFPSLPAGFRWRVKHKRAWAFLALQRETWYGWKTIRLTSVNPIGMTYNQALVSTARDILDSRATA